MTNLTKVPMKCLSVMCVVASLGCSALTEATGARPVQLDPAAYDAMGGGKLVFEREAGLISLNLLDGGARSSRVLMNGGSPQGATLSPDGKLLAYSVGYYLTEPKFVYWIDLAVRDLATNVETRLTRDAIIQGLPTWAPNGRDLIFPSNESIPTMFDYWQAPSSAGGATAPRNLTQFRHGAEGLNCPAGAHALRAVLSLRNELAFLCEGRVYIKAASSTSSEVFATAGQSGNVLSITWSPDGLRLAYAEVVGTNLVVSSAARSGSPATTIASVPAIDGSGGFYNRQSLCWTADGQRLFFNAPKSFESSQIWVVRSDGTGLHQITSEPGAFDYNVSCT